MSEAKDYEEMLDMNEDDDEIKLRDIHTSARGDVTIGGENIGEATDYKTIGGTNFENLYSEHGKLADCRHCKSGYPALMSDYTGAVKLECRDSSCKLAVTRRDGDFGALWLQWNTGVYTEEKIGEAIDEKREGIEVPMGESGDLNSGLDWEALKQMQADIAALEAEMPRVQGDHTVTYEQRLKDELALIAFKEELKIISSARLIHGPMNIRDVKSIDEQLTMLVDQLGKRVWGYVGKVMDERKRGIDGEQRGDKEESR